MRAGQAGVAVPEIVEAGTAGPSKDALLVCRLPAGTTLSEADAADVSDAALDDLYRQLLTLRRARIAHGAISGDALLVDSATETIVLADFRNATSNASPDQLDRDMAGAMAATAVAVGAERAADSAARCLDPDVLAAPSSICTGRGSTPRSAGACGASAGCWRTSVSAPPGPSRSTCRSWWSPAG